MTRSITRRVKGLQVRDEKGEFTIQQLLRTEGGNFSPKQRILVDFLHRNYQKVAFMNISELARETEVSEATIVRLAAMLKFNGYPGLQKAVQRIVSQELTTMDRLQLSLEANPHDDSVKKLLELEMHNISRLHQRISKEDVDLLRAQLVEAKHVVVLGVMASSPLSTYFGYELNRVLRHVTTLIEDNLVAKRTICEMGPRDLLVAFGFARYPAAVVRLLKVAGERGAHRWVITDTSASPLVPLAEQCLFVPSEIWSFVDFLAAPLTFLAWVVAGIVKREPELTTKRLREFETMAAKFDLFHHEV
jgi:DNA-binding MurR/RpiR family transcriptional regulator